VAPVRVLRLALLVAAMLQIAAWIITLSTVPPRFQTIVPDPPTSIGPGTADAPLAPADFAELRARATRLLSLQKGPLAPTPGQRQAIAAALARMPRAGKILLASSAAIERLLAPLSPAQRRYLAARPTPEARR